MHESSYNEMQKFVNGYLDHNRELSILEIGSLDLNGSYKPLFDNPKWTYIGLDLIEGKNVDVVSPEPYRYPFEDGAFDVVVSGSCMEHVEDLHAFIREAARVLKKKGTMCIIAPWVWEEHRYPRDYWRILPDGMKFLLEAIAGLPVLRIRKNDTDCIGIAGVNQIPVKISFGVMVNDPLKLDLILRKSEIQGNMHFARDPETATKGLNKLLDIIEAEGADIAILTHQDMFYRQGWIDQVREQLRLLPDDWIIAGPIGKDPDGDICGTIRNMQLPGAYRTGHKFPHPASCLDECCIIINMKKGFRFDENLDGFDLYGTLAVLQAKEQGGTAWILDAPCEHYCSRSFSWWPDKEFEKRFNWLHERFPKAERIDTTVLTIEAKEKLETLAA